MRSPAVEAKVQDEEPRELRERPAGQGEKKAGDKINDFFQSFETAGLALAFLMFPLVLTLATELHRGRPLTQSTIKPAFYAQCLYLSPFVVSIWIPILLYRYHPEPEEEFGYALILAVVIFLWLVIAEIRFVRGERTVSRFRSILWLAVPVGFVVTSLFLVACFRRPAQVRDLGVGGEYRHGADADPVHRERFCQTVAMGHPKKGRAPIPWR